MREAVIHKAVITLPFPISVNRMYAHAGKRRFPSKAFAAWKAEADRQVRIARVKPFTGPVDVVIELVPAVKRKRDSDNFRKCILDALVRGGVIPDDNSGIVKSDALFWRTAGPPCRVTISEAIGEGKAA